MIALQRRPVIGLWLLLLTGLAWSAPLPNRDEYAYGFALAVQGDAELFTADLPLRVYRSVTDPSMRDAGVYNAGAEAVPRRFEHPVADRSGSEEKVLLGLVPLYGPQAEQGDQLRVLLHKDASGIALDMNTGELNIPPAGGGDEAKTPGSYIVDLRKLEHAPQALEFDWPPLSQGFMGAIQLEHSADLQHWSNLGLSTLAEMQYEETLIERKRISLHAKVTHYLRISPRGMPKLWRLNTVSGIYSKQNAGIAREWLTMDGTQPDETGSEYFFDVGGYPPVDRANLVLPDDNVVVRASIFYRLNGDQAWRHSVSGVFYSLSRRDDAFQSPDVAVPDARAAEWKVRIDSGATTGPVGLRLGWLPDRLLFVAQGKPPFELVTGRGKDKLEDFPQDRILADSSIFEMLRQSGQAGVAAIGPRTVIAGEKGLNANAHVNLRTLLLWAGLIGAVMLVGRLVYSLLREIGRSQT